MVASDALSSDSNAAIDFFFPEKPIFLEEEVLVEKEVGSEEKSKDDEAKDETVDKVK